MGDTGAGPNDVPPIPINCGGCEPFAGEPRSQEIAGCDNLGRGFTPDARQLGELFYVTMITPIKQDNRLNAN
jgi:hypothetical protein